MARLKTEREIECIKKCGKIIGEIFLGLGEVIKPSLTTKELDIWIGEFIKKKGALAAFQGYRGYPANSCISVNEEVVHGIPGKRVLEEGDIVSVDVGVKVNGFYADGAMTFPVGEISPEKEKLIKVTQGALLRGIKKAKAGNRIGDIAWAIQSWVEKRGFSVVKVLAGHGTGYALHESPDVPNYGSPGKGVLLKEGMVLAIEPMVNQGKDRVKVLSNGWTVVTEDGRPSAHFEHTVVVRKRGAEILTLV